jgi:hypothetical protein
MQDVKQQIDTWYHPLKAGQQRERNKGDSIVLGLD